MLGDGSTKTFQIGQKLVRRPHVQTRVSRVENFGGGGCLSQSFRQHRGCSRYCNH